MNRLSPSLLALGRLVFALVLLAGLCQIRAAEPKPAAAKLRVSGYGLIGNRELKATLQLLQTSKERPTFYDANFIEDAALILHSRVTRDGFLSPSIRAQVTLEDGTSRSFALDPHIETPLPRPTRAQRVEFQIKPGVLYYFGELRFLGLSAISHKEAAHFFVETDALVRFKKTRVYTPQQLQRGLESLKEILERKGFEKAQLTLAVQRENHRTGEVEIEIQVEEGLRSFVRSVRKEVSSGITNAPTQTNRVIFAETGAEQGLKLLVGSPNVRSLMPRLRRDARKKNESIETNLPATPVFSRIWSQDLAQQLRITAYRQGYPDATVEIYPSARETTNGIIQVDLVARVKTGPHITLRSVRFDGQKKTNERLLQRRVQLQEGILLDRVLAEEGRHRLMRLGIFDSVEIDYDAIDEETRDILYRVREGKQIDFNLLFGFGSYELLRGGIEIEQYNIFGRAHRGRLRAVQSFRSSTVDYLYTMPELAGDDVDTFFNSSWLRREEVSFTREEFGGGLGARKYFKPISSDLSVRYNYQVLSATRREVDPTVGLPRATVGAFVFDLKHDLRDNPLYPRAGYKIFTTMEVASESLGGEVNYQRFEVSSSHHRSLGEGRWLHFGLSHGVIATINGPEVDLPFNKRFFPGGENSIRGYQQGEAAPRNARGNLVGAETYLLGNVEFEQSITRAWSFVTFFDGIGFARDLHDYPMAEALYSVGGGIRWKTIIGPLRLEYGHNLNPRQGDPSGTLHFSLGYPF